LTPTLREKYEITGDVKGVIVTDVAEDSPSFEKRVQPGDVIVEISQEPVATPDEVTARIEALKNDGRRSALLLLANKSGDLRFVAVNMEE
jgi:serine protease Do